MKKKISKKNAVIIAGAVVAVTAVGGTAYAMSGPKLALNKAKSDCRIRYTVQT